MSQAVPRLPRDHGHLGALDASYGYLRQFTPHVLEAVRFAGGTAATDLLAAVRSCASSTRPARTSGNTSAYRHFWELCTLLALRDGLRTGDVYVPGSLVHPPCVRT
ncbi:MAG: hypothetical protein ACR2G2_06385 [Pseudonocardia sp.]